MQNLIDSPYSPLILAALTAISATALVLFVIHALNSGADAYQRRYQTEDQLFKPSKPSVGEQMLFMPGLQFLMMKVACAVAAGFAGGLLGAYLSGPQRLLPVIALMVPAFVAPDILKRKAREARLKLFNSQMIEAMRIISNSLRANLTFPEAIRSVAKELDEPIAAEFALVHNEWKLGIPVEGALNNLTKRMPVQDLQLFVTSFNTVYSVGGRLREICDNCLETIQERLKVEEKIAAMTAEGRLQALILTIAPFLLLGALYFIDPSMVMLLFQTFAGIILLVIAIVLDVIGYFFIRKIIDIEV